MVGILGFLGLFFSRHNTLVLQSYTLFYKIVKDTLSSVNVGMIG